MGAPEVKSLIIMKLPTGDLRDRRRTQLLAGIDDTPPSLVRGGERA
ncbi:hypothetical protein [Halorientalis regularis]|jgi:hypothetical protein|nr:hypothetical protein [Halorientalis regularis]